MKPRRLVVLGTGTGVGKTHLSAALLRALRSAGGSSLGLKPIESGLDVDHPLRGSDAGRLSEACGIANPPLYCLAEPISPHLAAQRAGIDIDLGRVVRWVEEREAASGPVDLTLIETAGGAFSPLGHQATNLELALAVRRPEDLWLLVAPDALGVLHDVSATLAALAAHGRLPDALMLSASRPPDASTSTNQAELERLVLPRFAPGGGLTMLGTLGAGEPPSGSAACESFVMWLRSRPNFSGQSEDVPP